MRSISSRAWTDCEPVVSQPAPDSAVSTRGAKNPSATATTTQADEHDAEVGRGVAAEPADRSDARGHAATDLSDSGFR